MLELSCHCGAIRLELAARPDYIHACNCSLCSKAGAEWAYFTPGDVAVSGAASTYQRTDKPDAGADIAFCPRCGSTTHFTLSAATVARFGNTMMGVNMRLADRADLAGVEVRYPDGQAWPGEGPFAYVREPVVIGAE